MTDTKITKAERNAIRTILANSKKYDAQTLRIDRYGNVSAKLDADKTFCADDQTRYHVAHFGDMVWPNGEIREGW